MPWSRTSMSPPSTQRSSTVVTSAPVAIAFASRIPLMPPAEVPEMTSTTARPIPAFSIAAA